MEIPDLVRDALGDEGVQAGVNLGDEDLICLTPTRTLLYRAEGLLSDEKVQEFPHDIERLDVKEGRRKTKFVLEYVDETRSFSVPNSRDDPVLELLMAGILRAAGVATADETVAGAFRFSELALVVTDARVVKHIGSAVWTGDFAEYPYSDLTGLSFERGSVATELILEVDGRPDRIKTPNERAREVRQVVENAVFEYYGVDSLEALNDAVGTDRAEDSRDDADSDIDIGGGIDPLVSESEGESEPATADGDRTAATASGTPSEQAPAASDDAPVTDRARQAIDETGDGGGNRGGTETHRGQTNQTSGRLDEVEAELEELRTAVERQNELLEKQQRTINKLIEELREGRGDQ